MVVVVFVVVDVSVLPALLSAVVSLQATSDTAATAMAIIFFICCVFVYRSSAIGAISHLRLGA
jgi:hypothetical protein